MLSASLLCLVVGISDGDTLTARCGQPGAYEQVKVRIHAIDAPERTQPFRARQPDDVAEQKSACSRIQSQFAIGLAKSA